MSPHRVKTILAAPEGVDESCIAGTYYWPMESDNYEGKRVVETTNPDHLKILLQHGYTKLGEISIARPSGALGAIEVDELGRAGLCDALRARGLGFPAEASRADLESIAVGWNNARRRGRETASPAAVNKSEAADRAADEAKAKADEVVDFSRSTADDLRGWLSSHGVAYAANTPKTKLIELCEGVIAELKKSAA